MVGVDSVPPTIFVTTPKMEEYEEANRSIYTTPSNSHTAAGSESVEEQRGSPAASASTSHRHEQPLSPRQSSLPRALFNPPASTSASTSIFGSAPLPQQAPLREPYESPASISVSAPNHADLIASQSLPTFAGTGKSRYSWCEEETGPMLSQPNISRAEKEADNPTAPSSSSRSGISRQESTTLTTLSRLFAVKAPVSPEASRHPSYIHPSSPSWTYTRYQNGDCRGALPDHLYNRGFLEGTHSDITVHAFGHSYKLHRLILDRAPFFRSALSEPWLESTAKEIKIHPEDIDASITQASFELAIKRLYGCPSVEGEERDAVALFATGCWLEMQDLVESAMDSMLRQMTPDSLSPLIKLVTTNYYGRAGDKILASAKAMLCRDGWKMPMRYWNDIPGDIVREIIGGDGFFIDGEWSRWVLAKRILDRRLKARALEAGLVQDVGRRKKVQRAPNSAQLMAIRFDAVYRRNSVNTGRGIPGNLQRWISLYLNPEIEPILVLLDEGIHYMHLDFEQLQFIRSARDILGLPVMPEKVMSNALWQQMELRQKVMNARDVDMELDLSIKCHEDSAVLGASRDTTMNIMDPVSPPSDGTKGKQRGDDVPEPHIEDDFVDSGSWDGNGQPRRFWIPTSDCNIVMGGSDPVIATSNNTTLQRHASRSSATIHPEDVQWASDFAAVTSQPSQPRLPPPMPGEGLGVNSAFSRNGIGEVRYTHFPPFRFAAEFPNPRLLKEKKRVYSRTVFYAGSLWNIYIQKVASSKSKQLGVYLHRAKERETEEVIAGTAGLAQGSVDERIGQLEREMILRRDRHERHGRRTASGVEQVEPDNVDLSDYEFEASDPTPTSSRSNTLRNLLNRSSYPQQQQKLGSKTDTLTSSNFTSDEQSDFLTPDSDDSEDCDPHPTDVEDHSRLSAASKRSHIPTLPPYVDARPTIKTYFKIYAPSRGGRMLSVYESAPDRFNFSQSWGWKSASLMIDDGPLGDIEQQQADEGADGAVRGDGKLRFMVVIGNI